LFIGVPIGVMEQVQIVQKP